MAIDWNNIDNTYENHFPEYAGDGVYKVPVVGVTLETSSKKGTKGLRFAFGDTEDGKVMPKYPTTHYCLGDKNKDWRAYHNRGLMVVLGASKQDAERAVESCESNADPASAYLKAFERLVARKPVAEVEVFHRHADDRYPTCDFTSRSVRMGRPEDDTPSDGGDGEMLESTDDIPF